MKKLLFLAVVLRLVGFDGAVSYFEQASLEACIANGQTAVNNGYYRSYSCELGD